jgi:hypothetical protein
MTIRKHIPRNPRILVVLFAFLAIGVLVIALLSPQSVPASASSSLDAVSNGSAAPSLALDDDELLKRGTLAGVREFGTVSVLSSRGERTYYRVGNNAGPDCFAVGVATLTHPALGQVICSPTFPSVETPILDFTVFHNGRVWRSEGVVADGVASVVFRLGDGSTTARTYVSENVFQIPGSDHDPTITGLIGLDAEGNVVHVIDYRHE